MKEKQKITRYAGIPKNVTAVFLSVMLVVLSAIQERSMVLAQKTNTVSGETAADDTAADDTAADAEDSPKELVKKEPVNKSSQGYDVVYVIDNSKSVWKQQEIRNQAFRNISNLAVGADIRIGIVYFADHVYEDYKLSLTPMEKSDDSDKVMEKLDMKEKDRGNVDTNIGNALEEAAAMFDAQDSSRKRIVILFSDGINENDAQEKSYSDRADRKTKQQVKELEKMDVQIHCVYLQQKRNDEKYLKKLVNYFSDENTFDQERFSKVKKENVDNLMDKFADVFYKMQNNMKFHKIRLDAEGEEQFYVPSLGIRKFQIYVEADPKHVEFFSDPPSEYEYWNDHSAAFFECKDPSIGGWTIHVKNSEPEKVKGTIAYYAYLQAAAEVVRTEKEGPKADKNAEYELAVHFYDQNGKEVELDSAAEVRAELVSDENNKSGEIALSVKDGVARSEPFTADFYGSFRFNVHLSYEDFVNMDFELDGGTIEKTAPAVHNLDQTFYGEKTEHGLTAAVKENELYEDPENETVTIGEVVQLNPDNPVTADQKDGYVYITSEKSGNIKFALKLKDASGMESEVTVQGSMKDQKTTRMVNLLIKLAVLLVLLLILCWLVRLLYRKSGIKKAFVEIDRRQDEFQELHKKCRKELEAIDQLNQFFHYALFTDGTDGEKKGVKLLADSLSAQQCRDFRIDSYLEENFIEKSFFKTKEANRRIDRAVKDMDDLVQEKKRVKEHKNSIGAAYAVLKRCCKLAEREVENLKDRLAELEQENSRLDQMLDQIGDAADRIEEMLETEIQCDLILEQVADMPGVEGKKVCRSRLRAGSYLKGFYQLEDIRILGKDRLGAYIGSTGVCVYGYYDKNGEPGLELRSENEFYCRCLQDDSRPQAVREAVLLQGCSYELQIHAQKQDVRMTVRLV